MALPVRTNLHGNQTDDLDLEATPQQIVKSDGSDGVTLLGAEVDNTGNTAAVYLKLYDAAASPTLGTTDPDAVFKIPASTRRAILFNNNAGLGTTNKRWAACVTGAGTGGTTGPTNDVQVTFWTD